ncbi:hypothetical protein ASZ90_009496 [hydrocarbon metagenome]|uniref:Uncharacterized protein n=1 Tax=hydrocarbon metagenome TaxID=938273 RepID=A0A0W8FJI1_9ZZZZ|nr:DUF2703 domain-containing protein [Methanomicrobiaceae archaeon]
MAERELIVEWRHMPGGIDDLRHESEKRGMRAMGVVREIATLLEEEGVSVRIVETVLSDKAAEESERILFNGVPLEDLVEGMEVTATPGGPCAGCAGCEMGESDYEGEECEAILPELIGRAALKALGVDTTAE